MHCVKVGERYINADTITSVEVRRAAGQIEVRVHFLGGLDLRLTGAEGEALAAFLDQQATASAPPQPRNGP